MLTARQLRRDGLSVTLLERGELCRESSWAGGGILSPLVPWQYPDAVSVLVGWSQRYYPGLVEELRAVTGVDSEWLPSGLLMVDTGINPEITAWAGKFQCRVREVAAMDVHAHEPALTGEAGASLLLPDVAQIRNPCLCRALGKWLPMQGVDVREHTAVTGLSVRHDSIQGVTTDGGDLAADRVVIAGGAWSSQILQGYGRELPVSPVRGQMILFRARPGLLRHIVLHQGHYLIPRQDGLILAGSTLEYAGYDKETSQSAREMLVRAASDLVPDLSGFEVVKQWAGLRPGTETGVPYIGEHPEIRGLYLNTGHFRNGVVMAPASAQLLTDSLQGRDSFTGFEPYRL
jgi:glycine oxidase